MICIARQPHCSSRKSLIFYHGTPRPWRCGLSLPANARFFKIGIITVCKYIFLSVNEFLKDLIAESFLETHCVQRLFAQISTDRDIVQPALP